MRTDPLIWLGVILLLLLFDSYEDEILQVGMEQIEKIYTIWRYISRENEKILASLSICRGKADENDW